MGLEISHRAKKVRPSSTLSIAETVTKLRAEGKKVVSFTVGQPDFNTPQNICEAGKKAIDAGYTKYTAVAGYEDLRVAIAKKLKEENLLEYKPEQIVTGNGAKHCLMNTFNAIINAGDEVIIPSPYWLSYPEMVKLADGIPVYIETTKEIKFKITKEMLEAAITDNTKALLLTSPSNPTGMIYTKQELEELAKVIIEKDIYVISDEIYEYLNYTGEKYTSIGSLNPEIQKRTITINGLSKAAAMTGWRFGYVAAPLNVAKAIASMQSHQTSNICSITQKAAYEALVGDVSVRDDMIKAFSKRRKLILEELKAVDLVDVVVPDGAFYVMVDCEKLLGLSHKGREITGADDIADILINDYLVAVIPCADFGVPNYIRISYSIDEADIVCGVRGIKEFIEEVKIGRGENREI